MKPLWTSLTVVNGRKGRDAFTCISGRGCSVVDYGIVGKEDFGMIEGFKVMTMSEVVEEMRCEGVATRVPDHSLMHWEVAVDWEREVKGEAGEAVVEKRYRVPEGYLDDEVGRVRMLIG